MTHKESLNKVAQDYASGVIKSLSYNGVPNSISDIKSMLAKAFLAGAKWQQHKSSWIKIEDGCAMPKDAMYILVRRHYRDKYGQFATKITQEIYFAEYGFNIFCCKRCNERITHWMPIPKI